MTNPQPNPTPNDRPYIAPQVAIDILQRMPKGYNKYGVYLQPFNGRKSLLDAYEEAGDLLQYLKQLLLEQEELFKAIDEAVAAIKDENLTRTERAIVHLATLKQQMSGETPTPANECKDGFCPMPNKTGQAIEPYNPNEPPREYFYKVDVDDTAIE